MSGADGKFLFSSVQVGSYYLNVTKAGYITNRSSVFAVSSNSTVNIGNISLLNYDANSDGKKNVLDLYSIILKQFDLNNDGAVNASDVLIVAEKLDVII